MKPVTFVGSSSEALSVAQEVQSQLSDVSDVIIWNQGLFRPGDIVLERLSEIIDDFDFAILIFAEDDAAVVRGESWLIARDNTVLEAGMFISRLGRRRTLIMTPNTRAVKLPSDLNGLVCATYQPNSPHPPAAIGQACHSIRAHLRNLGTRDREQYLSRSVRYTLAEIARRGSPSDGDIALALAEFNGVAPALFNPNDGWLKAAHYCLALLKSFRLVEERAFTIREFTITDKGQRYLRIYHE